MRRMGRGGGQRHHAGATIYVLLMTCGRVRCCIYRYINGIPHPSDRILIPVTEFYNLQLLPKIKRPVLLVIDCLEAEAVNFCSFDTYQALDVYPLVLAAISQKAWECIRSIRNHAFK